MEINPNVTIPLEIIGKTGGNRIDPNIGYITYKDRKGKLAREASWKKWSDAKPFTQDNKPKLGFKVYGNVGGGRGWSDRCAWVQIQDPSGFVIEISPDNFIELITTVGYTPETGFNKPLSYAWCNNQLSLIELSDDDFNNLAATLSSVEVKLKDLTPGHYYKSKTLEGYYLGKREIIKFNEIDEWKAKRLGKPFEIIPKYVKVHVFFHNKYFKTTQSSTLPFIENISKEPLSDVLIQSKLVSYMDIAVTENAVHSHIEPGPITEFYIPEKYKLTDSYTPPKEVLWPTKPLCGDDWNITIWLMSPDKKELRRTVSTRSYSEKCDPETDSMYIWQTFTIQDDGKIVRNEIARSPYRRSETYYYKGVGELKKAFPEWDIYYLATNSRQDICPMLQNSKGFRFYNLWSIY